MKSVIMLSPVRNAVFGDMPVPGVVLVHPLRAHQPGDGASGYGNALSSARAVSGGRVDGQSAATIGGTPMALVQVTLLRGGSRDIWFNADAISFMYAAQTPGEWNVTMNNNLTHVVSEEDAGRLFAVMDARPRP
jgi:hypothetical protein